jgi:hypothetical protein
MRKNASERLHMAAPKEWLERIDQWRREQPDLPNLSEAVRRLVDAGLRESPKKKPDRSAQR